MYATAFPRRERITLAPSCLNRPSAVCFTGGSSGAYGSISTIQPNRFGSFSYPGLRASNRGSSSSHPYPVAASRRP
ncbi:Uncharacterised protein [Mycobacteroides abscessus]|nr:Uncharacterised protein [Mycobacteroides abscessus]